MQGKIDIDECDKMVDKLQRCLDDIQVFRWFTDEWKVLTEAEIVLPEGITRRPDRVMIKGERAVVVDYKFGLTTPAKDKAQVSQYLLLLREMGYKAEGYLWYVEPGRVIAVL